MKEIILTLSPKLGDSLYGLAIGQWLMEHRNAKIHWVMTNFFNPFNFLPNLLLMQPCTSRVSIVPFTLTDYGCGGQPYRYDPDQKWEWKETHYIADGLIKCVEKVEATKGETNIPGEYYNLGFRHYPDKYISAFFAEEHGFDYVRDYVIDLGEPLPKTDEVLRSTEAPMAKWVPHANSLGTHEDLLELSRRCHAAKEVHSWFGGIAILTCLSKTPVTVHRVPGHAYIPFYYEAPYCDHVTFIEHPPWEG